MIIIHCSADFGTEFNYHAQKIFTANISDVKGNEERIHKKMEIEFDEKCNSWNKNPNDKQNFTCYYYSLENEITI